MTESTFTNPLDGVRIESIAIFRALQLGDMLCSIPSIRAIRDKWPTAKITLIGLPWQKDFAERFREYFNEFIEFPGWPGLPERDYQVPDVLDFLAMVQRRNFDLVIQMQGNGYIVNPMCMLFGGKFTAGLRRADDYCPNETLFPVIAESENEISRFMKIAQALGARSRGVDLEFPIMKNEWKNFQEMAAQMKLTKGKYVCLHAGARDPRRRWPACDFGRVGNALVARGYTVLITGSISEKEILKDVQRCMNTGCLNLVEECGHVGIGELAAIIHDSAGLVSNDTGVSHIASALRTKSVVIFSPYSDPCRWAPVDRNLHRVIEAEESKNVMYVINSVLAHLDFQHQDEPARAVRNQYIPG